MAATNRVMPRKPAAPDRRLKITIAIFLAVSLIALSVFLALGGPTGLANRPGIFGTEANLFSDINLIAQVLLLIALGVGYLMARRHNVAAHQYIQTAVVLFNITLTVFIMIMAYVEYVLPSASSELTSAHGIVATIHAVIGLLAIACGVYLILRMNKLIPVSWRISWWRKLMRITLVLYWLVGILGILIYIIWYVG
jgi:uncharacterized membrane protein YozB (DUF420 family)